MSYALTKKTHAAVVAEGNGERPDWRWVVVLNAYQRDNLLALLNWCGYPGGGEDSQESIGDFRYGNSGDWLGELAWMLADPHTGSIVAEADGGRPNRTRASLVEDLARLHESLTPSNESQRSTPIHDGKEPR